MSAHLERESGPLRFVVDAVALHRRHANELDVPLPGRADHEARDALRIAPYAHFRNPRAITFSPGNDQLLRDRPAIQETPDGERIAHDREVWICERHDLRRVSQDGFERPRPQIADLEDCLDVLLIALARVLGELAIARARR